MHATGSAASTARGFAPAAPRAPRAAPAPPPPARRAAAAARPAAAAGEGDAQVGRFFEAGGEAAAREELFSAISPVYDELNDVLSLGLHRVWKRMAVRWSGAAPGCAALDVCCGSGDLALALAEAAGPRGRVEALDFSAAMLADAARREARARAGGAAPRLAPVAWTRGDALALPYADCAFDAATVGYGLRNVADIPRALAELRRVLRPGGRVAVLDFNNAADNPLADAAQAFFLERLAVPAAEARGVGDEYRYLRPSIQRFPPGREQERLARAAGFAEATHYPIAFGLMGVLVARRAL
jgi:ubiquinone/menaquinone biosynthesis methyltransferase